MVLDPHLYFQMIKRWSILFGVSRGTLSLAWKRLYIEPPASPGLQLTAGFLWLEPIGVGVGDQKKNSLLQQHKEYQVQTRNLELRHQ